MKWSYSSMDLFKQCPKKYFHLRIAKDVKQKTTDALYYGREMHTAAENYIKDGTPIPAKFGFIQPFLDPLVELPGDKYCEYKMGLTEDLKPCDFKDPEAWWTGIADLLVVDSDVGYLVDYKTGKSSEYADKKQLELLSLAVFKHHPKIKKIRGALMFVVANDLIKQNYEVKQAQQLWLNWIDDTYRMEHAHATQTWNASPNFTCRKFCPVESCSHNGRGGY